MNTFVEHRFAGSQLIDLTIRSQELQEQVLSWFVAEGLLKTDGRASAPFRDGLVQFFVGLVAANGSLQIHSRDLRVWQQDCGSRIYLDLLDRMTELQFFYGTPTTGQNIRLSPKAEPLIKIIRQFIKG